MNSESTNKRSERLPLVNSGRHADSVRIVFPLRFPIAHNDLNFLAFANDPHVFPPGPVRRAIWQETVGKHLWAKSREEASKANAQAKASHTAVVETIEAENHRIDLSNESATRDYKRQLAKYARQLSKYEKTYTGDALLRLIDKKRQRVIARAEDERSEVQTTVRQLQGRAAIDGIHEELLVIATIGSLIATPSPFVAPIVTAIAFILFASSAARYEFFLASAVRNACSGYIDSRGTRFPFSSLILPLLLSIVPGVSFLLVLMWWHTLGEFQKGAENWYTDQFHGVRRRQRLYAFEERMRKPEAIRKLLKGAVAPTRPQAPQLQSRRSIPEPPPLVVASVPTPPADYYDKVESRQGPIVVRGSKLYDVEVVRDLARQFIFENKEVRPFFTHVGVPLPILFEQASHFLLIGASGSGKSTFMTSLMSAFLPLTKGQAAEVTARSPELSLRRPVNAHEWSRSLTHQAIVYDAKREHVPKLAALGFDPAVDMFIFDTEDSRGVAWDVATDVDDRVSIEKFVDALVPAPLSRNELSEKDAFWEQQARYLIEAVIVSFRNAAINAGRKPDWNLRDLVNAFDSKSNLKSVLRFHDTPSSISEQHLDLADTQASSVYMTASNQIKKFKSAANRWHAAQREGRTLSLKTWAKEYAHSVLVLPNTLSNPLVNLALNRALLKTLTNLTLSDEYSRVLDAEGRTHTLRRYFFFDELGYAGYLPDIERLMGEGRSFGAQVITGLQQLSQLQKTYGKEAADSIIGHHSYMALMKNGDVETVEWACKRIGRALHEYSRTATTSGESDGTTLMKQEGRNDGTTRVVQRTAMRGGSIARSNSSNKSLMQGWSRDHRRQMIHSGSHSTQESETETTSDQWQDSESAGEQDTHGTNSSESVSRIHSENSSQTVSRELREELTVFASEIMSMPNPETDGIAAAISIASGFPIWRADLTKDEVPVYYQEPQALTRVRKVVGWSDDEAVSKSTSWNQDDVKRLCLDRQPKQSGLIPNITVHQIADEGKGVSPLSDDFEF